MSQPFEIRVTIKDELKKALIFGLEARLPIGIILGFIGYRHQVLPLMQSLTHATRAYIVNAGGLPGFLAAFDAMKLLK